MPKRKTNPTQANSKLARVRVESGVTRAELADATYISLRALQDLEGGGVQNPGIKTLNRIAYALDVPIEDICEESWLWVAWQERIGRDWVEKSVRKLVEREPDGRAGRKREV